MLWGNFVRKMLSYIWQSAALFGRIPVSFPSPCLILGKPLPRDREVSYPVPHCSTLVMFSCSRLLTQAINSCLSIQNISLGLDPHSIMSFNTDLDSPIFGWFAGKDGNRSSIAVESGSFNARSARHGIFQLNQVTAGVI